jgi:hypothetical protein
MHDSQVKYREDGAVDQFQSDISVLGPRGSELLRKAISVNDPLRFRVRAHARALHAVLPGCRACGRVTSLSPRRLHISTPRASPGEAAGGIIQEPEVLCCRQLCWVPISPRRACTGTSKRRLHGQCDSVCSRAGHVPSPVTTPKPHRSCVGTSARACTRWPIARSPTDPRPAATLAQDARPALRGACPRVDRAAARRRCPGQLPGFAPEAAPAPGIGHIHPNLPHPTRAPRRA